jgi:hypothetical protein
MANYLLILSKEDYFMIEFKLYHKHCKNKEYKEYKNA